MPKKSAGLLMYRRSNGSVEVFLVHPGGPYWEKNDLGAWSIPKGEYGDDEAPLDAAKREFSEETGLIAEGSFIDLTEVRQPSGKRVRAWAFESDCDPAVVVSNSFTMEWPPKSGNVAEFPEIDKGAWYSLSHAEIKILKGQLPFLRKLADVLGCDVDEW